jgi:serine/threonine protein phosphatase PrpC
MIKIFAVLLLGCHASTFSAYFESKTVIIPADSKIDRGGEDSAHVSDTIIAVADGVGGWARQGINPGLFSKALTREIRDLHQANPGMSTRDLTINAHAVAS